MSYAEQTLGNSEAVLEVNVFLASMVEEVVVTAKEKGYYIRFTAWNVESQV